MEHYNATLYNEKYSKPDRENMPKDWSEMINPVHLWAHAGPVLFVVTLAGMYLSGPPSNESMGGALFLLLCMIWSFVSVVMLPTHLIVLLFHKQIRREAIIEWARRGWVRTGFEPDKEMLQEARRRNDEMERKLRGEPKKAKPATNRTYRGCMSFNNDRQEPSG